MRPVPIDEDWGDSFQKITVAAPNGDLTDDEIRPVEALLGPVLLNGQIAPAFHVKVMLEEEDVHKIVHGQRHFWLILYGSRMQPFAIEMRPNIDE